MKHYIAACQVTTLSVGHLVNITLLITYWIWGSKDSIIFLEQVCVHGLSLLQIVLGQFCCGCFHEKFCVSKVLQALEEIDVGATATSESRHVGTCVKWG